ncbi:MAG: bifunctional alpha/beta hydrolase/OsmC family protein, partial [Bauldia litoralis]
GGRTFCIRKQFLEDIEEHRLADIIGGLRKALLVFHGPRDDLVSIDNASKIFLAAKHPKSFVSLDDADHLLSRRQDAIYVAEVLAAWASRYVGVLEETDAEAEAEPPFKVERGELIVYEAGTGRFAQIIDDGRHRLHADEPESIGGDDTGPSPYGYLAAALGACTSMTMRMYADRKEWPVERIAVRVRHEKVHAEDSADSERKPGKIDRLERDLHIEGDLTDEQRERLKEIANKCPVHQTLERCNEIVTELRPRDE